MGVSSPSLAGVSHAGCRLWEQMPWRVRRPHQSQARLIFPERSVGAAVAVLGHGLAAKAMGGERLHV